MGFDYGAEPLEASPVVHLVANYVRHVGLGPLPIKLRYILTFDAELSGKVLTLLEKEVIVDIGYKSEGVIALEEFRGAEVKVGDRVDVLLEKTEDGSGYVVLSKEKAERLVIWDKVEKAYETGEPVMGRVIERIKGGL